MNRTAGKEPTLINATTHPAANLRMLRIHARLTLQDVAEAAGTSESWLSKIETGKRTASVPFIGRIAGVIAAHMENGHPIGPTEGATQQLEGAEGAKVPHAESLGTLVAPSTEDATKMPTPVELASSAPSAPWEPTDAEIRRLGMLLPRSRQQ